MYKNGVITVVRTGEASARNTARKPLFLLLTGAATLCLGALSFSFGLLFLCALALATAMQAVLFRAGRPLLCLVMVLPALALSYLVTGGVLMLFPVASCTVAAFFLARLSRAGESRSATAAVLLAVYAVALIISLALALAAHMQADGQTDILAYLDRTMSEALGGIADLFAETYAELSAVYEKMNVEVVIPTREEIHEALLLFASLLPSLGLLVCALPALGATYILQLVSLLTDERALLTPENRVYRPGALVAGTYLLALPIGFLWGDFRDALCLTCMNVAVFLTPVLAFGALLHAPRVVAFMRRMSFGMVDFIFFLILLIIFIFANMLTALLLMAAVYAIYILKSTFFPGKKNGQG